MPRVCIVPVVPIPKFADLELQDVALVGGLAGLALVQDVVAQQIARGGEHGDAEHDEEDQQFEDPLEAERGAGCEEEAAAAAHDVRGRQVHVGGQPGQVQDAVPVEEDGALMSTKPAPSSTKAVMSCWSAKIETPFFRSSMMGLETRGRGDTQRVLLSKMLMRSSGTQSRA